MKLRVKDMDIATGDVQVVIINRQDAQLLDLHPEDRMLVRRGKHSTVAILDIAESAKAVPRGEVGMFEEVLDALHAKEGDVVDISLTEKPRSISFIKKKLDGHTLSASELREIINDITKNNLSQIELTSFVTANYANGMTMREVVDMTKAMVATGDRLKPKSRIVADVHCIGGVPGNRTTLIIVPILVAAGLTVPKTASRAITSPAGTADTMEVLCSVTLSKQKLERVLHEVGGFITWGGAINLAPSDDKIINVEHPLSIDAEGQMLASIMAKKATVGATHLLMDLPIGQGAKLRGLSEAMHLRRHFEQLGRMLGIKIRVIVTDGSQPIGNGIGPALEARDCLWLLENDKRAPVDLRRKSLQMAAQLLEFTGKTKTGMQLATKLLESGKAHDAMVRIIRAQHGSITHGDDVPLGQFHASVKASKSGKVRSIDNLFIGRVARLAGAPHDHGAGIYLHVHKGTKVRKGTPLLTVYSENQLKLRYALDEARCKECIRIR